MNKFSILKMTVAISWILIIILGIVSLIPNIYTVIFLSTIIFGSFFCGWLCPFGFLQDILYSVGRKLKLPTFNVPNSFHKYMKYIRYIVFLILLIPVGTWVVSIFLYDPRSNFDLILAGNIVSTIAFVTLALFSILSLFARRLYCNYLCVLGAQYSIFSLGRVMTIKRGDKCVECGKCTKACPMHIDLLNSEEVKSIQCINCMKCVESCNIKGAIQYRKRFSMKKLLIGILLCITFLGFNYYIKNISNNQQADTSEVINSSVEPQTADDLVDGGDLIETQVLRGSANGFKSQITVDVTKKGDQIINISVVSQNDDARWFNSALRVINDMLNAQSTDVDVVSGATYSSQGIINATKDALGEDFKEQTVKNNRRH